MTDTCATCKFFDLLNDGLTIERNGYVQGHCRRRPPVSISHLLTEAEQECATESSSWSYSFPVVPSVQWCGKFLTKQENYRDLDQESLDLFLKYRKDTGDLTFPEIEHSLGHLFSSPKLLKRWVAHELHKLGWSRGVFTDGSSVWKPRKTAD